MGEELRKPADLVAAHGPFTQGRLERFLKSAKARAKSQAEGRGGPAPVGVGVPSSEAVSVQPQRVQWPRAGRHSHKQRPFPPLAKPGAGPRALLRSGGCVPIGAGNVTVARATERSCAAHRAARRSDPG